MFGVLDSSFLFFPFGNDLLVAALTARDHAHLPLYVVAAALGSAGGVVLLDLVVCKEGEEGLEKLMSRSRLKYLKKKFSKRAAGAVAVASLAPPPFPFTVVIAAASAFQYPRPRLFSVVLGARAIRFSLVGLLALRFGPRILRIVHTPGFEWFMLLFIALCAFGSVVQVIRWSRRASLERVS